MNNTENRFDSLLTKCILVYNQWLTYYIGWQVRLTANKVILCDSGPASSLVSIVS